MAQSEPKRTRRLQRDENSPSFLDDPVVREMLLSLDQLERKTDHRDPDSENDKDALANLALKIAAKLGDYVSGWASDHKVGLAIEGMENIPDRASLARTPEYNDLRKSMNSHRHEIAALTKSLTDKEKRKALLNQLSAMSCGLHSPLLDALVEAIEALEYGETLPILEPTKDSLKKGFRELRLHLWALCYIEYKQTIGEARKGHLQSNVAEAFGVSESTVRGWERQLPSQLNSFYVAYALSRARHCGEWDRAKGERHFENTWGTAPLLKWGADYRVVLGYNQAKSD